MSDDKKEEAQPKTFTSIVKPSEEEIKKRTVDTTTPEVKQETLNNTALSAQEKIVKGLSDIMTQNQIDNMQKLAPMDEFEIGGKTYKRNKIKPKMVRELRQAERQYNEDIKLIEDPDLRQDRDWQLLFFKAKLYFGMTEQEFEDTDLEKLQTVIQATELRTQGFRKY